MRWLKGAVVIECSVCHEDNCIRCKKTHTAKCAESYAGLSQASESPVAEPELNGNGKPLETDFDALIDQNKVQKTPETEQDTENTTGTGDPEHVVSSENVSEYSQSFSQTVSEYDDSENEQQATISVISVASVVYSTPVATSSKSDEPGSSFLTGTVGRKRLFEESVNGESLL